MRRFFILGKWIISVVKVGKFLVIKMNLFSIRIFIWEKRMMSAVNVVNYLVREFIFYYIRKVILK